MNHDLAKKSYEMGIFTQFVEASGLQSVLDLNSIESCDPPQPDISCKRIDNKILYFELVEIGDGRIAQNLASVSEFSNLMKSHLNSLSANNVRKFREIYRNAGIGFTFHNISRTKLLNIIPNIFTFLLQQPFDIQGEIQNIPGLQNVIKRITIRRNKLNIQYFTRRTVIAYGDPVFEQIETKFQKHYKAAGIISLLFYYRHQEVLSPSEPKYENKKIRLKEYLKKNITDSLFSNVYGFDVNSGSIFFKYETV